MSNFKDLTGNKYGRLLAVRPVKLPNVNGMCWECLCDCGNTYIARSWKLTAGCALSCGCLMQEHRKAFGQQQFTRNRSGRLKHGYSRHPLYKVFCGMKQRCYSPKSNVYPYYGGRGISICKEWLEDPVSFIRWGIENGYKSGLQIDRIDNEQGYSPTNCRFVTPKDNLSNRRPFKYHSSGLKGP